VTVDVRADTTFLGPHWPPSAFLCSPDIPMQLYSTADAVVHLGKCSPLPRISMLTSNRKSRSHVPRRTIGPSCGLPLSCAGGASGQFADGRHVACTTKLVALSIRVQVRDRRKFVNDHVARQSEHDPNPL